MEEFINSLRKQLEEDRSAALCEAGKWVTGSANHNAHSARARGLDLALERLNALSVIPTKNGYYRIYWKHCEAPSQVLVGGVKKGETPWFMRVISDKPRTDWDLVKKCELIQEITGGEW